MSLYRRAERETPREAARRKRAGASESESIDDAGGASESVTNTAHGISESDSAAHATARGQVSDARLRGPYGRQRGEGGPRSTRSGRRAASIAAVEGTGGGDRRGTARRRLRDLWRGMTYLRNQVYVGRRNIVRERRSPPRPLVGASRHARPVSRPRARMNFENVERETIVAYEEREREREKDLS